MTAARKTPERPSRGLTRKSKFTGFRFTQETYDRILKLAQERDMNVTEYITKAALGELEIHTIDISDRVDGIEERLERLEEMAQLGGLG